MMRSKTAWLFSLLGLLLPLLLVAGEEGTGRSTAEKRVALLIGNGAYAGDNLGVLNNPTNDAEDLAKILKEFGFEVLIHKNLKKPAMNEAIADFGRRAGHAHAALFYFAGHGLQIKGQNYLMPVDATANSEASVAYEGVNVNYILEEMENARSNVNMVMLDACRNNTFSGQFRGGKHRGLAPPASVPKGTVIVYATDPGNVASDGEGKNGLFTAGLLAGFKDRDLSLDGVLTTASKYVEEKSAREQTPYVNGPQTVMKQFKFRPEQPPATVVAAATGQLPPPSGAGQLPPSSGVGQADREALFWQSAQGDVEICQEYLKKYPQGEFVVPAKRCVEKGKRSAPAAAPAPAVPAPVAAPAPVSPPVAQPAPPAVTENKLEPLDREMVAGRAVPLLESMDVRSKPLRELEPGEKVHILGRTTDGKWYWGEVKGWVWSKSGYLPADALLEKSAWEESKRKQGGEQKPRGEVERSTTERLPPALTKGEESRKGGSGKGKTEPPPRQGGGLCAEQ
ncbi:MAG: caspase family protein [Magnetococcus sp. XQGC-1]